MSLFNKKRLYISLLATALLMGCASTDPYKPQSDKDFVYDPAKSFAMNVIDGSLGFHNGLTDANRPKDADTTTGAGSYAADAIIGFGNGGGLGGAFLSMLGTNTGNAPLNHTYGIAYIPVESFEQVNMDKALSSLEKIVSIGASKTFDITYTKKVKYKTFELYTYHGDECLRRQNMFKKDQEELGITDPLDCVAAGHTSPTLLSKTTTTPNGSTGKYLVFGLEKMSYQTFFRAAINIPSLSEFGEFYYFVPASPTNSLPFVYFNQKAHLFIKPDGNNLSSISIENLEKISPKLFGK
ncbi:hypothetical protein L5L78_08110 [Shewanella sp. SM34]|uniref:hypothetical protein n=1 Tax=unclassified Shewanella TaxID=196818 RepID=UPI0021DB533D|nr:MULTISPECIES: hypothetical protein [unclassified Shewanella]MCU8056163.1 hypothetical protein [Shewanella sp. SM35]MCU8065097.1 hypothetical protein [Shewanella sp. SM34]